MCEATFSLSYPDEADARRVERALRPEVGDVDGDRTRTTLERAGTEVRVAVVAEDLVGLRAGINTWLSLAGVAERGGGIDPAGSTEPG